MATSPLRPCSYPHCQRLTAGGPCALHRRERQQGADRHRGTAQARGYDYRWSQFSKDWREKYPVCGMRADGQLHAEHSQCVAQGRLTTTDLVVDHRVRLEDGGAKYDPANLQTLCRACNTRKDSGWSFRRTA